MNFLSYLLKKENVNTAAIKDFFKFNKWFIEHIHNVGVKILCVEKSRGIAYLNISKCGLSSFNSNLKSVGGEYVKYKSIPANKDFYLFTYVRNPFSRLVSCYMNRIVYFIKKTGLSWYERMAYYGGYLNKDEGFEAFARKIAEIPDKLADEHFSSMYLRVYENGERKVDFVGKLEEVNETFEEIRKKYDLPEMEKKNVSPSYRWQDYYTQELAEIVYKRYKEDFEYFGYEEEYAKLVEEIKNREK